MQPHTVFINEPGIYRLIMRSRMKKAIEFQDWIYEIVIPSIRKTGEYKLQKQLKSLKKQNNNLQNNNNNLEKEIDQLKFKDLQITNFIKNIKTKEKKFSRY